MQQKLSIRTALAASVLTATWVLTAVAPSMAKEPPKRVIAHAVSGSLPASDYRQVGTTDLYYRVMQNSIDFCGMLNDMYYGSTYSNNGYKLAMCVNSGGSSLVNCISGSTVSDVTCLPEVVQQGEFARVIYHVTNNGDTDAVVSLGTHADVMIGSNDRAPIVRRIDTMGNTYGITMSDRSDASLCVLFGAGLVGVNAVSDYWFGTYSLNSSPENMTGQYSSGSNYMVENGSYDSGMGWCWKDRAIPAGSTVDFSYLIGVGDVSLEPNSSFSVTPDDPSGWNDLTRPHDLTIEGIYESPTGQSGYIEYAAEDSEEWLTLTDELKSGDEFTATLTVIFTPGREQHIIRFRAIDGVGNTTMLHPIVYRDVASATFSGFDARTYDFGRPITLDSVTSSDLDKDDFTLAGYTDNINAGTARVNIEGVFPNTIGRTMHTFVIEPFDISDSTVLFDFSDSPTLEGTPCFSTLSILPWTPYVHTPEWHFENEELDTTINPADPDMLACVWSDNIYPGEATLTLRGNGNFTGTHTASFTILPGDIREAYDWAYEHLTLPPEDITADEKPHVAELPEVSQLGLSIVYYRDESDSPMPNGEYPVEAGTYSIGVRVDSDLYDATLYEPDMSVYTFHIYDLDATERDMLGKICHMLTLAGWTGGWDPSDPLFHVDNPDISITRGHIKYLDMSESSIVGEFPVNLLSLPALESLDLSGNRLTSDLTNLSVTLRTAGINTSQLRNLDISYNEFSGNAGMFAALFPSLETLNASHNRISQIVPAFDNSLKADISAQSLDNILDIQTSHPDPEQMLSQVPTVLLYDSETHNYRTSLNVMLTESAPEEFSYDSDTDWSMQLKYNQTDGLTIPFISHQNAYFGECGEQVNVLLLDRDNNPEGTTLRAALSFDEGDANFVGGLTVVDLQALILYIFDRYSEYPFNFTAADTFRDNRLNVQDVVKTVSMLLDTPVETAVRRNAPCAETTEPDVRLWIEDDIVWLESAIPVGALSLRHTDGFEWNIADYGMTVSIRPEATVIYSPAAISIPAGRHAIGKVSGDCRLLYVEASSEDARTLRIGGAPGNTLSVGIATDSDTEGMTYRSDGIRTSENASGLKVTIHNGKTAKRLTSKSPD